MDKEPKKELIEGIKDLFNEYEESYTSEAWTDFQSYRKNPKFNDPKNKTIRPIIKWMAISASFIAVCFAAENLVSTYLEEKRSEIEQNPSDKSKGKNQSFEEKYEEPLQKKENRESNNSKDEHNNSKIDSLKAITEDQINTNIKEPIGFISERNTRGLIVRTKNPDYVKIKQPALSLINRFTLKVKPFQIINQAPSKISRIEKRTIEFKPQNIREQMEYKRTEREALASSKKSDKKSSDTTKPSNQGSTNKIRESLSNLSIGLELNPAITSKSITLGGGVSAEYYITEKIALATGINYLDLKGGTKMHPSALADSNLTQSINTHIKAFSIPIKATYRINKQLYTSIGVNYLTIIDTDRTDVFREKKWIDNTGPDGNPKSKWIIEESKVPGNTPSFSGKSFIGFIDLSMGYNAPFLKSFKGTLIPYVKVPIGALSEKDNKMLHGGLTLRVLLK